jgi:integrase
VKGAGLSEFGLESASHISPKTWKRLCRRKEKRPMPLRKRGPKWHYRFVINGQEHAGSTGLRATEENRGAAEKVEKHQRQVVLSGRPFERSKDFATAAGEFIAWCKDSEYRQKPSTAARIETSFASALEFFGTTPVGEMGAGEIERYKMHRSQVNKVRDITVRHDCHALSLFFQYAAKMRWREGNPIREVTIPSDRDSFRMHPLTPEEEKQYFETAHAVKDQNGRRNLYDVATIILNQGCRPDEIMSAKKCHLDVKAGALLIAGGKSRAARRTLHLTPSSLKILKARLKGQSEWLFPSERYAGNHITKLNSSHDRACIAAGVSFVLYDLRHTFGTRQATELKTDPFTLAAIMGHSNLRTIMRYVHPEQRLQKEAMEKYAAAMRCAALKRAK